MDETDGQKPLSLRFESKNFWDDLRHAYGVDKTGAAIILDICSVAGWVSYSRTSRHYDTPARYRNPLYTFRKVVGQIDYLVELGLLEHEKCAPGRRGWQSAIRPTDQLRDGYAKIVGGSKLILAKRGEVILLRDSKGKLIDYTDTRDLGRARRRIESFNEAIAGGEIDPSVIAPLARIYNETMKRGGRLYAMGPSWQNMKSEARRSLTIAGEPVVELDYCTLHPAILYAEAGVTMPLDCYEIAGWPRHLVKVAMLTLINATTIHKARHSIAHSDGRKIDETTKERVTGPDDKQLMQALTEPGSQDALQKADTLIKAIKAMHKPIAKSFHSDAGARLMTIDAALAEAVMNIMLMQGVVVLPVHDSFLVQASKSDQLESAMLEAAHKMGLMALEVSAK